MKKYFFLTAFIIVGSLGILNAQSPLYLDGITSTNSTFGYYDETGIIAANTAPVILTVGTGSYEFTANNYITLNRGFIATASGGATNHFKAEIANQQLDATILEPSNISTIPLYSKVEFGISIPSLEARINEFLNDVTGQYKPGTSGYNNAFNNGTILNPYDPVHISIDAVFAKPSQPNGNFIIRHGFFYNEFERDTVAEDWIDSESGIDPYEWRLRLAPDETGTWKGFINVYVNDIKLPENYFFTFTVVSSYIPGFVSVASNDQYLQFSNGNQFFPVGDNYAFPLCDFSCPTENCVNSSDHRYLPSNWIKNEKYVERLSNSGNGGGNHTRVWLAPWGYEIEWEKLGNYHTRQIEMFELDEYIELCEQNDIYFMLTTMNYTNIKSDVNYWGLSSGNYSENWEWNPYNGLITTNAAPYNTYNDPNRVFKGISGVEDYIDFFNDATARQFYKNKLNYINNRWGYSPNFYANEFCNEISQCDTLFFTDSAKNIAAENWVVEMAEYWKIEIDATPLTTVTYVGDGEDLMGPPASYTTDIWDSPHIDLVCGHDYTTKLDGLTKKSTVVQNTLEEYSKPCIFNEFSFLNYNIMEPCNTYGLHKSLWSSAFSGSYGPGMGWQWLRYTSDDWHQIPEANFENEYITVREFFENVDLLNYNYLPNNSYYYHITSVDLEPTEFQNFYMVRDDMHKLYGWFSNRSMNEYTDTGSCDYFEHATLDTNGDCFKAKYQNMQEILLADPVAANSYLVSGEDYTTFFPVDYQQYSLASSTFELNGLIPFYFYTIEYMYTSGPLAGTFDSDYIDTIYTNDLGRYVVTNGPPTGNGYPSDWAYIVHLPNEPRSLIAEHYIGFTDQDSNKLNRSDYASASVIPEIEVKNHILNFGVYPNPNNGVFTIDFDFPNQRSSTLSLMDVAGNIIQNINIQINEGRNRIYYLNTEISAGTYFIRIDGINEIFKVIIVI